MKKKRIAYRQGDVWIERVDSIPVGAVPKDRDEGRVVLAYGEVTGHAHAIVEAEAELLVVETEEFLRVTAERGVDLIHEEHSTITIPAGDYKIVHQVEYAPEAIRNVAD